MKILGVMYLVLAAAGIILAWLSPYSWTAQLTITCWCTSGGIWCLIDLIRRK